MYRSRKLLFIDLSNFVMQTSLVYSWGYMDHCLQFACVVSVCLNFLCLLVLFWSLTSDHLEYLHCEQPDLELLFRFPQYGGFFSFSFTAILVLLFRPLQLIIHPYVCIILSRCFRSMLEFNSVTQSLTEENFLQYIPYTAISLLTSDGNVHQL